MAQEKRFSAAKPAKSGYKSFADIGVFKPDVAKPGAEQPAAAGPVKASAPMPPARRAAPEPAQPQPEIRLVPRAAPASKPTPTEDCHPPKPEPAADEPEPFNMPDRELDLPAEPTEEAPMPPEQPQPVPPPAAAGTQSPSSEVAVMDAVVDVIGHSERARAWRTAVDSMVLPPAPRVVQRIALPGGAVEIALHGTPDAALALNALQAVIPALLMVEKLIGEHKKAGEE